MGRTQQTKDPSASRFCGLMERPSEEAQEDPIRRQIRSLQERPPAEAEEGTTPEADQLEAQKIAALIMDPEDSGALEALAGDCAAKPEDMIREDKAEDADDFKRIAKEIEPTAREGEELSMVDGFSVAFTSGLCGDCTRRKHEEEPPK